MPKSFTELVDITYFTPENARFYETKNGFAALEAFIPPVVKDDLDEILLEEGAASSGSTEVVKGSAGSASDPSGDKGNDASGKECVWQDLGRVFFHRAFPYELPDEFISVLDKDSKEYGIIKSLSDFDDQAKEIINKALKRKYYCPEITKIHSLKDQFGYSYWDVETDNGRMEVVLKDTFSSIARISDVFIVITDISGNRYKISDLETFDRKSYRKIELFL